MPDSYDKRDQYLQLFENSVGENLSKELTLYLAIVYLDDEQQERLLKIILLALEKSKKNDYRSLQYKRKNARIWRTHQKNMWN